MTVDRLAEATHGRLHWNDPEMDRFEKGDEGFTLGLRVEVRVNEDEKGIGKWIPGVIVETINENDRAIVVLCDERWHDNFKFYQGRGALIPVILNTKRGILSNIRVLWNKIPQPDSINNASAHNLSIV